MIYLNCMVNNYAFIDAQNVHLSIKRLGWELDWQRFRVMLHDKYHVTKALIFIGNVPGNSALYYYLQNAGFELIFKDTILQKDGNYKGNVDAELVLYSAAIEYPNYDKAVVISGDGDFACLVHYLQQNDKLEKLIVPDEKRYSALLKRFSLATDNPLHFLNQSHNKLKKK